MLRAQDNKTTPGVALKATPLYLILGLKCIHLSKLPRNFGQAMPRRNRKPDSRSVLVTITKHDLATRYNVSTRTIGRWMKGRTIHTLQDLLNLIAEWDQSN